MMELIPIEHIITDKAQELFCNAILYENAGLEVMANDRKYEALEDICKTSNLEIITMNENRVSGEDGDVDGKYNHYEWGFVYINKYKDEVPFDILFKMEKIEQKDRLAILYKGTSPDPVLLYYTGLKHPDSSHKVFIKIDEWE